MDKPAVLLLQGAIQHYDWGGRDFIPSLLGLANPGAEPFAELWIGAHPKAPALADAEGRTIPLDRLIAESPDRILGPVAEKRFGGRLPYLFKVLDVAKMLSIQAHPTRIQAQEGFARENAAGIALQATERNYKDDNHKPEIGVALAESWLLHGFRPLEQIAELLPSIPELHSIMPEFSERLAEAGQHKLSRHTLLREFYGRVMTLPQARVDVLLQSLLTRIRAKAPAGKDQPDYWAMRAAGSSSPSGGHYDRGIFSIYLLNLLHLRPGQGSFQPAGVLHAYLEGVNVELMANSDNVLRGGLTPKHIDVPELLRILSFESAIAEVIDGDPVSDTESIYRTAAEEFELSRIELPPRGQYQGRAAEGPDALLVLEGSATLTAAGRSLTLKRGSIAFAPFGVRYELEAQAGKAVLFKAAVPRPGGQSLHKPGS